MKLSDYTNKMIVAEENKYLDKLAVLLYDIKSKVISAAKEGYTNVRINMCEDCFLNKIYLEDLEASVKNLFPNDYVRFVQNTNVIGCDYYLITWDYKKSFLVNTSYRKCKAYMVNEEGRLHDC